MSDGIDWFQWRERTEAFLENAIGSPCYVVLDLEIGSFGVDAWGVVWPGLANNLRDEIGDRWRGDGPGTIVCVDRIERHARASFAEIRPSFNADVESMASGVAAHEAGHWLEIMDQGVRIEETDCAIAPPGTVFTGLAATNAAICRRDEMLSPLGQTTGQSQSKQRQPLTLFQCRKPAAEHGPRFCWNALHTLHRMQIAGIDADQVACIDHELFGLARPAYVMERAIRDELRALEAVALTVVSRMELPGKFVCLFEGGSQC